jgi:hypothetical protein
VATKALDIANARSLFGYGLGLGYMADYGEEQPPWWILRFCPGDVPLIIAIEVEQSSTGSRRMGPARGHGWLCDSRRPKASGDGPRPHAGPIEPLSVQSDQRS